MIDYSQYSDTVLYDVFYEAGTQLAGALIAARRRATDAVRASELRDELLALYQERAEVDPLNREEQIVKIVQWEQRRHSLACKAVVAA